MQVLQLCLPLLCRLTAAHACYATLCAFCARLAVQLVSFSVSRASPVVLVSELLETLSKCCAAAATPLPAHAKPAHVPLFVRTFPPTAPDLPWTAAPRTDTSAPESLIATLGLTQPVATALTGWLLPILAFTFATQAVALEPHTGTIVHTLAAALYAAPLSSLPPALNTLTTLAQRPDTSDTVCAHAAAPDILSAACALLQPAGSAGADVASAAAGLCATLASALLRSGVAAPADVRVVALSPVLSALAQPSTAGHDRAAPHSQQQSTAARAAAAHAEGRASLLALARTLLVAVGTPAELLQSLWAAPRSTLEALADSSGQRVDLFAVTGAHAPVQHAEGLMEACAMPAKRQRVSTGSDTENAAAGANGGLARADKSAAAQAQGKHAGGAAAAAAPTQTGRTGVARIAWGCPEAALEGALIADRVQRLATAALVLQCTASLVRMSILLAPCTLVCMLYTSLNWQVQHAGLLHTRHP